MKKIEELRLKKFAAVIRKETIEALFSLGLGHIGGAMSIVELLALLYGKTMTYDAKNPAMEHRDRLILSKGHASPSLYAALALQGFFPLNWLSTINRPGTRLPSHADCTKTPGIDMTTGSLGQGISSAMGIALGCKLKKLQNKIYVVVGDGECAEGQVWEAVMFAKQHQLNNLIVFVDANKYQLDGTVAEILDLEPLADKFAGFGWRTLEVENGNSIQQLLDCFEKITEKAAATPTAVIMHTEKGAGYPAAKGVPNHHMVIDKKGRDEAVNLLEREIADLDGQIKKAEKEGAK